MAKRAAIEARRAIRHLALNHQVPYDGINRLMSLAMLSPAAFNIQDRR